MRIVFTIPLVISLMALPAIAQSATQNTDQGSSTSQQSTDQNQGTMQKAGTATKDAAKDVGSATEKGSISLADKIRDKVDLNKANEHDLMNLVGMTKTRANKIIENRPYEKKSDLLTRHIVSKNEYNKISDHIIVHKSTIPNAAASNSSTK